MVHKEDVIRLMQVIRDEAKKQGFTDEELGRTDLSGASDWTHSRRYYRMIRLAYARGELAGIRWLRTVLSQPELHGLSGQSAVTEDQEVRWVQRLRGYSLGTHRAQPGFTEAELDDPSHDFSQWTRSVRIVHYCNLAYVRGMLRAVRYAEEMGRPITLRSAFKSRPLDPN